MNGSLISLVVEQLFTFQTIIALFFGVVGGILIGGLPGLSSTMAVALLTPITFSMEPVPGLVMLTAIYTSATYGGSLAAILIHTPGTPAAAATAIDGYHMTKQGKSSKAIGIATISSMIGGFISGLSLLLLAPPLARLSLMFSGPEYLLLAIFGLTIIGSLSSGSMLKGLTSGAIGLLIGTIGIDITTGYPRFTFGNPSLEAGISLIPALIGLFSLSQVFILLEDIKVSDELSKISKTIDKVLPMMTEFRKITPTILRSSGLGVLVGILPGAGGDIGSWIGYNEAKRFSKNKDDFGKGSIEGVSGSETANNAVTGGALIPLMTLGIPGSSTTAVLLGGLMIQGLNPGNELFTTNAHLTYAVIIGFILANIVMGIVGLLGAKYFAKILDVPQVILIPIIVVFCVVGSFAINNSIFDVWIMLLFGLLGYLIRKTGYSTAPIILGMILGPIAETGLNQGLAMTQGNFLIFLLSRPISLIFIILILLSLLSPLVLKIFKKKYNYS